MRMTYATAMVLFVACAPEPEGGPPDRRNVPDPVPPTETGAPPDTETEDSEAVPFDCDVLPEAPISSTIMDEVRAYHGIGFDDDGNLIGFDGSRSLMKAPYDGVSTLFIPGMSWVEQIDRLPDGDFAVAEPGADRLTRVTPDGATSAIATGVGWLYGVTVGPDGNVYIANGDVHRVVVETGEVELLVDLGNRSSAHALDFNLDSTTMFIGTIGAGQLLAVPLDDDLNPVGEAEAVAVFGSWHDGVRVDECGDIWVADYSTSSLYRVSGDDYEVHNFLRASGRDYGHGLMWGNGIGGWRTDALYLPLPYNGSTVKEVVIGARSGAGVRTWKGKPVVTP